jgi:hypothetical protein
MDITFFGWALLFVSSTLSILNIGLLFHLISKRKEGMIERNLDLNTKEFDLLQRQYIFLQAKTDINLKRLDAVEKILSVLIVTKQFDDGSDGILH